MRYVGVIGGVRKSRCRGVKVNNVAFVRMGCFYYLKRCY